MTKREIFDEQAKLLQILDKAHDNIAIKFPKEWASHPEANQYEDYVRATLETLDLIEAALQHCRTLIHGRPT